MSDNKNNNKPKTKIRDIGDRERTRAIRHFCIKITNNEICYQVFMRIFTRIEKDKKKIIINICYSEGIRVLDISKGTVLLDNISSHNIFSYICCKANSHLET